MLVEFVAVMDIVAGMEQDIVAAIVFVDEAAEFVEELVAGMVENIAALAV